MRADEPRNRVCQRPGCGRFVKGSARFCSGKCREEDRREGLRERLPDQCPHCGAVLRRGRGRPRKSEQVQQAKEATR